MQQAVHIDFAYGTKQSSTESVIKRTKSAKQNSSYNSYQHFDLSMRKILRCDLVRAIKSY